MFSMPELGGGAEQSYISYPEIPELTAREKLMMEREATGMFFSGQLLDSFTKHLQTITTTPIAEFVGEESDPVDRAPATIAGMITAVTPKTTKSGERMAFFRLEDQTGEIECVAFAKKFEQIGHLIRSDVAVCVTGNLSVREEEKAKLLVNQMVELVENASFDESKVETVKPVVAPKAAPVSKPKRLFLRLPGRENPLWKKARNLIEIFEGEFPVAFYDASEKQYDFEIPSVVLSDYLLSELRSMLGEENVILK